MCKDVERCVVMCQRCVKNERCVKTCHNVSKMFYNVFKDIERCVVICQRCVIMCHRCVLRCVIICQRCQDRQDHFVEDDAMMSDSLSSERLAVATQLCVF